ncbi:MAG: hypothetical protein WA421_19675 [Nitrososphaeraceae archaeon]
MDTERESVSAIRGAVSAMTYRVDTASLIWSNLTDTQTDKKITK